MKKVGFFYNPIFLEHKTSPGHPESPERLNSIINRLANDPLTDQLVHISSFPSRAPESLYAIHDRDYVKWVEKSIKGGAGVLDFGDTTVSDRSYDAAIIAADAIVEAAIQVWEGKLDSAFAAVRPPGHHAERGRAMGFCLFNNIAIAAAYLMKIGAKKVAIADWDVHHGNGTQSAFYGEGRVLFISLHQYPHYPGTGAAGEIGEGDGKGTTINIPMFAGSDGDDYLKAFDEKVIPALDDFAPEIILISAGFDSHNDDPLSSICLETDNYGQMTGLLMDIATKHCGGKLVSTLEGGYNLRAMPDAVLAHLKTLAV